AGVPALAGTAAGAAAEIEYRPVRRRLPKTRPSQTVSFAVGGAEGYLTAGSYPDDGLGEVFIKMSKQGSTLAGVMDAFAIAISIGLQYGVPLEAYVSKFINMRFEPAGMTDDPDVRIAQSIMDYLFRRLALDYLDADHRAELGISTAAERVREVNGRYGPQADAADAAVDAVPASAGSLTDGLSDADAPGVGRAVGGSVVGGSAVGPVGAGSASTASRPGPG
ncbi:vitamin B12-dependent ribonucleotide reductase, partial [Frankia sp. AiPs1]|nr:vitamin B12-dependent ribonucleotide reductase [Frankia sp. AiPs1]